MVLHRHPTYHILSHHFQLVNCVANMTDIVCPTVIGLVLFTASSLPYREGALYGNIILKKGVLPPE